MKTEELVAMAQHAEPQVRNEAFLRITSSYDQNLLQPLAEKATPESSYMEILLCRFLQNMPPTLSLPHLKELLKSPNKSTRASALNVLSLIHINQRLEVMIELLEYSNPDVILFSLEEFSKYKKTLAISSIAKLLDSDNWQIVEAAFSALENINAPRSIRLLIPFLDVQDPQRQVAALNTLGKMSVFKQWKLFLPALRSKDSRVKKAAVLNLARKGGKKSYPYLVPLLETEEDVEILKLVSSQLSQGPTPRVTKALIKTAALHPKPQVRRAAGWIIEEVEEKLLQECMVSLLPKSSEKMTSYILSKMGHRQLPNCGKIIAYYVIKKNTSIQVRVAALEGLGFLGKKEFLPVVVPYMNSKVDLEAYVATVSAAQLTHKFKECPELVKLLQTRNKDNVVQRQVVLQYMLNSITWGFDDEELFGILKDNLTDENVNIRYFSVILLANCQRKEIVPDLVSLALNDPESTVRKVAQNTLKEILQGNMSPFLDCVEEKKIPAASQEKFFHLMTELDWNQESFRRALEVMKNLLRTTKDQKIFPVITKLARKLFASNTEAAMDYCLKKDEEDNTWRIILAQVWLESLGDLISDEEKTCWQKLFQDKDTRIVHSAVQKAVETEAEWTAQLILDRISHQPDDRIVPDLREAVKKILHL